ncbi:efflux RND transporter permease subunit [Corallococcus macrosporus]|uniref:Acriflavine resistance protein B n=1 Tax=Corallococcus macrosporus DSM 14697 TaxID=1189310 RepID=A0A250JM36_9BACT|nr:efflux RND transporter permease subunit [Corallococcus macrosporus]ATB44532.1 acriflavine resistance protein B [Corallococcus macrosporus DSM 14697]
MPRFFIERPVFAWVIAIFIVLAGAISIPRLPIERYPSIAPPSVTITATYPGATPAAMNDSVVSLIERGLSGVKNILYFESSSDTSGVAQIVVTFAPGTDPDLAQVDIQNRLKTVESRLPQMVRQLGLQVETTTTNFLLFSTLLSSDGRYDEAELGDFLSRNVVEDLRRVPGVGRVQLFTPSRALRVWLDPERLISHGISVDEVAAAIRAQNAEASPGRLGDTPAVPGQRVTTPLMLQGQLQDVADFEHVIVRANPDGSNVLLKELAKVELGPQSYATTTRQNGKNAATFGVQLAPGANALDTSERIRERMADLSRSFPAGVEYTIPYDAAPFVRISIQKVVQTFFEAMLLVFAVMYLFLQSVRYTLIPAIVAPIALLGTFAVMLASGFSINVLTMFGMVLAIGIIVDDAIVVVENVERLMAEEGLSPLDATKKAMKEITGAVIGITLVLTSVFIPMAFATGSVGTIYRQFSLAMAVSILFSAFLALTLTPALCATLLKPVAHGHTAKRGFFGAFNRLLERVTARYAAWTGAIVRRLGRAFFAYAAVLAMVAFAFWRLPGAFFPEEDQGFLNVSVQLPSDATAERTNAVLGEVESYLGGREGIQDVLTIQGFGFFGSGANAGLMFVMMNDWDARKGATAPGEVAAASARFASPREGMVINVIPPAVDGLGNSAGFAMRLEDRAGHGTQALNDAMNHVLRRAYESKVIAFPYQEGLPDGSTVRIQVDRERAAALGVSFADINSVISTALGSTYVNDFPNKGYMQQIILQARAESRMQVEDVLKLPVRNVRGQMVPLSSVAEPVWERGPMQLVRYNGYPAVRIAGTAAPGYSSGDAMAEMERIAAELPQGFAVEWTGLSYQERLSGSEAPILLALSMLVVFLVLAALYESWSIPLSVMLVVPLGLIGALAAVLSRGLMNDIFFKVGLITIIGLSAKNAILIVEFAKQLEEQGRSPLQAAVEAARLRFRPILMTSLAFALGVVPLVVASGASAETQRAIGTGVFGGMVSGTVLAIFLVPAFYVAVRSLLKRRDAVVEAPSVKEAPVGSH